MRIANKAGLSTLALMAMMHSAQAMQIEVLPSDYSFDKGTDCGSYCYHDFTTGQLTDGEYGVAPWSANLGNGNAYEWLGWVNDSPVNIDFDFGVATGIDSIQVGTVQDHVNDVVVPNVHVYSSSDGLSWSFVDQLLTPESSANNNQYFSLELNNLGINDQYVRVSAAHSLNGPWTFIDEVDFLQNVTDGSVPEPASLLLMSGGLLGFAAMRRRQRR